MNFKTKIFGILALALLSGCASTDPLRVQTSDERHEMFSRLSGNYRVVDSRKNYSKYSNVALTLADKNGTAIVTTENGAKQTYRLFKCEIANQAQAANTGSPIESVEDLVRCDIASNYKYAQVYIGKVRNGYTVKDQAVIRTFDPIVINGGYLIELSLDVGSRVVISASR